MEKCHWYYLSAIYFSGNASHEGGMDNPIYASTEESNVNMAEGDGNDMFDSTA